MITRLNDACLYALAVDLASAGFASPCDVPEGHPLRSEIDEVSGLDQDRLAHFLMGFRFGGDFEEVGYVAPKPEVVPQVYVRDAELAGMRRLALGLCAALAVALLILVQQAVVINDLQGRWPR